jgi:hypothetical protein
MIPAAILLVIAAAGFDAVVHVPIEQALAVFVGLPLFLLGFAWVLVRITQPPVARPVRRPVRGEVVVSRPPVYRIADTQYGTPIPAPRLRILRGDRNDAP